MKYAIITPPTGLPLVKEFNLGYHFVLSQYCTDPVYKEFYREAHSRGHFIIVDNGAAELGASIDIATVTQVADDLGADEIILPDVLDDCAKTLEYTERALEFVPVKRRAMCPQGGNWFEWLLCAKKMVDWGCATLCVAKRYERFPGGRPYALQMIMERGWHKTCNIHLLGCYENPLREIARAYHTFPGIRGVDTGAAIAYAQAGADLGDSKIHHSLSWTAPIPPHLARLNIEKYLNAHKGSYAYTD